VDAIRTILPAIVVTAAVGVAFYVHTASSSTVAGAEIAQPWGGCQSAGRGALRHVLGQLGLSPQQTARIASICTQSSAQLQSMLRAGRAIHQVLESSGPADPGHAAALAAATANAVGRVQFEDDVRARIYAVLTPAQRAQVPTIVAAEQRPGD